MPREAVVFIEEQTWHILTSSKYENFILVYLNKIINIRNLKIAEFNFKLFHQILPCKTFFCKIGVTSDNKCSWCDKVESVEHMGFSCYSIQNIWYVLSEMLVLSTNNIGKDWLISLVQYLILQRWVLNQNGKKVL